ncbi:MAG: putative zinc-binding protein [Candidatus Verstraetearchaeota archaeon]|nr:putative zinc-binding protein [Candidatus Verstraetearchaeota archaeon]
MSSSGISKYQLLPHCATHASELIMVATCDGAASVGQVGNEVARKLTKTFPDKVRMCCLSAVAAGSKTHVDIFKKAKAVIAINGCQNMCASNVLRQKGIEPTYEVVIAKEGVNKLPSLDFSDEDVDRISDKIVKEFLSKF